MASSFRLVSSFKSESRIRILCRSLQARRCSSRSCQNEPQVSTAEPKYALGRIGNFSQSTQWRWLCALPFAMAVSAGACLVGFEPQTSGCEANETLRVGGKGSTELVVKGSHKELPEGFLDELKAVCGDRVILDYDDRYFHGKPQHSFHTVVNIPDVVVCPMSTEEVSKIVKACNKYKIPIVPYGGATSIEGHTLAPHGGLCIDMTSMKNVKALHLEDMDVVVEPGIGWIELNEYLLPYGLFFPLDPGPGATIGGMCATRCSGSLAVRYGTMRDNVINLQVVLANGDVVKTASRARKSAAGYDLTRLLIGSEGTLGVITQVTLRLQKIPESTVVAMCNFPTIKDAADVAIATMHSGIQVSRVELLDEVQVRALNNANGKDLPEFPTLMFEFVGTEAYAREQTLRVQNISKEHHGFDFVFVETPEEKEKLWKVSTKLNGRGVDWYYTNSVFTTATATTTDTSTATIDGLEEISSNLSRLQVSHKRLWFLRSYHLKVFQYSGLCGTRWDSHGTWRVSMVYDCIVYVCNTETSKIIWIGHQMLYFRSWPSRYGTNIHEFVPEFKSSFNVIIEVVNYFVDYNLLLGQSQLYSSISIDINSNR